MLQIAADVIRIPLVACFIFYCFFHDFLKENLYSLVTIVFLSLVFPAFQTKIFSIYLVVKIASVCIDLIAQSILPQIFFMRQYYSQRRKNMH